MHYHHALPLATLYYHSLPCNTTFNHVLLLNTMHYHCYHVLLLATLLTTMQYH